ncbi:hypothetical protein D0501_05565 [Leuconostoc holzapfelii]|uniref:WxL domain-containing protein n=1 Tax=Leuconostoc holzapfelii TaxID=434464 RepID=A0ABT2NVZ9_9LACO|nr:hypothetical protein [Leuconostoc holzapfelii]MCT8389540.1 hypothetical protein [Leuconostoc holzapfelii]
MKKTLVLSVTAALLTGALAPAVFADSTTSSSTTAAPAASSTNVTHASGKLTATVDTDNVMPIVSGTTSYDFGHITYAWGSDGKASLTKGTAQSSGNFSIQNLNTLNTWTLSATYNDNAQDSNGNQAVSIPDLTLKPSDLKQYDTTTVKPNGATLNLANGTQTFDGTVSYTITTANVQ